ncbi:MAG: YggS family pyridoxal phosphate-dependent enzyme [Bacteroidales bacterium]|nr:YggS family pyridoxal phosphate-dependent enzyme [Candidatus Minthousia equi]
MSNESFIGHQIKEITAELPASARLVAISKYHPASSIEEAYAAGQRVFGESHVQELIGKEACLPKDIEWHFIGHLQTNKVKYIAPFISLIHAVDTIKLLREINKQAEKNNRVIDCLIQLHIAQEETKFGFTYEECRELLSSNEWKELKHINLRGLMCMASNTDDMNQVQQEFHEMHAFFEEMQQMVINDAPQFNELSMGMSHDYPIAVKEGSTLVRVGSKIFGNRIY